jgi:ribosome-associated translation inhibitor RaiA
LKDRSIEIIEYPDRVKEGAMQLPLQIAVRGFELEGWTEALIRKCAEKLEQYHDRVTGIRVMVEVPQRQMGEPIMYNVRFDITVPGGELVVKRQPHPELHTAIQRAFDATRRRLQDYVRRQRGDVKAHASPRRRDRRRPRGNVVTES